MAVIYRIRNKETGKCYIGETKCMDPYERWNQHIKLARKNKGCTALKNAIRKYGVESFVFEVLIFCFDEDRFKYEKEYIAKHNTMAPNGYNLTPGGEGGPAFLGKKHSKESIEKIKASLKKVVITEEYKRKMSEKAIKQFQCPEARKKVSDGLKNSEAYKKAVKDGRVGGGSHEYTPEIRNKISESLKKHYTTHSGNKCNIEKHREAMANAVGTKVYQYSLDGTFVQFHESLHSASRSIQIGRNAIAQVLDKPNRMSAGYRWKTTGPEEV
jgi:group I intron endonuclease